MTIRYLSATSRLTAGLVGLTVSVCLLATTFGILPNQRQVDSDRRHKLCETVAFSCSVLAADQDHAKMQEGLDYLLRHNQDVISAGIRDARGTLVAQVGQHEKSSDPEDARDQRGLLVNAPIIAGADRWGLLEIVFRSNVSAGILGWIQHPWVQLVAFVVAMSYLLYFFYLRNMIEHLDPSKIIPDRVRTTLDTLAEGLLVVDKNERIVLANRTFAETVGRGAPELVGRRASSLPWDLEQTNRSTEIFPWVKAIRQGAAQIGEMLVMTDGTTQRRVFKVNASPIVGSDGRSRGAFASFADVTVIEKNRAEMQEMLDNLSQSRDEIRRQNRELERLATQDPLTMCLNRRSLFQQFESHWNRSQRYGQPLSCVLMDLDYFKSVNDRHGHSVGDLVLQKVAGTLRQAVRDCDIVGRYGGEEFCVVFPNLDLVEATEASNRLRQKIASLNLSNLSVTASFGVSSMSLGASSPHKMLEQADRSLYEAKRNGRNQVVRYDDVPPETETAKSRQANDFDLERLAGMSELVARTEEDFDETIPFHAVTALTSALAYRDESTAEHSRRVADLCVATAIGTMSVADTYVLEVAALLHDIGKIGVPDSILLKPGPLTPEEWKVMGVHDRIGIEIVSSTFASLALLEIIESHHAFYGGRGRQANMTKGKEIPLGARVLAIADAYDAMVSERVYRQGMQSSEAFEELRRCAGTQFDPELVEHFIDVVTEYDTNRQQDLSPVSKQTALRIGEQIERLAKALDEEDLPGLAALAGRLNATALKQGVNEIAKVAADLQAAACEIDVPESIRLTNELLDLCRSTQRVYLDCIRTDGEPAIETVQES